MPNVNAETGEFFTVQVNDLFQSVVDRVLTPYGTREAWPEYGFEIDTWTRLTRPALRAALERAILSDALADTLDIEYQDRGRVEAVVNSAVRVGFAVGPVDVRERTGILGFEYWPVLNSAVRVGVSAGNDDRVSYDLREYLRFATAPIGVVREFAEQVELGAYTEIFGEGVERRLAAIFWVLYANRNKEAALEAYMRAIGGFHVTNFTAVGGHGRGSVDVCVAALPASVLSSADTLLEIRRALVWLLPFYVAGTTLTVSSCDEARTSVRMGVSGTSRTLLDLRVHGG